MIQWILKPFNELKVNELYDIMRLRQEVFIVEQTCPYLDADGKDIKCYHLLGINDNNLTAYSRIVPPGVSYKEVSIGRVVSAFKYRRHAYGKELMRQSIIAIERLYGNVPIRIGAQQYLKRFYEDFGFVQQGESYMEDGIPHIIMLRS
jgi:ElaA protein